MYQDDKSDVKNGLYSIGAISEVTGLSVTAIRYYSEKGLIVPSYIDEDTGYRYYSSRHVWKLEKIKMFKKLGFSLKDMQTLQNAQDLDVLEEMIFKSEESARKKLEEYKEMLRNLTWLREQCYIFRNSKADNGFMYRDIPERKVMYMNGNSETNSFFDLAMLHQKQVEKELQKQKTIQRCYGYFLNLPALLNGDFRIDGEYIDLGKKEYSSCKEEELRVIPAGRYLCFRKTYAGLLDRDWILSVVGRFKEEGIHPKSVHIEEVSLYLLNLENTIYEMQILIDK